MERSNIEKKINELIIDLGIEEDKITSSAKLEDLGLIDEDVEELAVYLEDTFDIAIKEGDEFKWETVKDIVDYVEKALQ
jgi:acyl carrier protein